MQPLKSARRIANWLFRISFLLFGVLSNWKTSASFNLNSKSSVLGLVFMVLSILLFIGGFMKKHTMTVVSALGLVCLCVLQIILSWNGSISQDFAAQMIIGSVAFYFLANGNS